MKKDKWFPIGAVIVPEHPITHVPIFVTVTITTFDKDGFVEVLDFGKIYKNNFELYEEK